MERIQALYHARLASEKIAKTPVVMNTSPEPVQNILAEEEVRSAMVRIIKEQYPDEELSEKTLDYIYSLAVTSLAPYLLQRRPGVLKRKTSSVAAYAQLEKEGTELAPLLQNYNAAKRKKRTARQLAPQPGTPRAEIKKDCVSAAMTAPAAVTVSDTVTVPADGANGTNC